MMKILNTYKNFLFVFLFSLLFQKNLLGQERYRIAVLNVNNQAKLKNEEIEHLTNIIRQNLATSMGKNYLVMTQENILTLLPENKKIEDCLNECEVDVGRNLGASLIVTGSILIFNKNYRLNIKVHETKEGALLASEISKGNNLDEVEESIAVSTGKLINSIKKSKEEVLINNEKDIKKEIEAETEFEDITYSLPVKFSSGRNNNNNVKKENLDQNKKNELVYQLTEEFKEIENKNKKEENIDLNQYENLSSNIDNTGWAINAGVGNSLSYSGIGNQLGFSYNGNTGVYRLIVNYGILQYESQESIPGLSFQTYFGESSTHNIGFGINFISCKLNNSNTYTMTSFDFIYRWDIGDLNGFEILIGPSLEVKNTDLLDEDDQIKNIVDISGTFLLGLNYVLK